MSRLERASTVLELAAEQNPATVLPLPLVPFEEYMLLDDRPAYPMSFFFRLRFSGRLDRAALESALRSAAGRHPLLSATIRKTGRRFEWVPADGWSPEVCWLPMPANGGYPRVTRIDLFSEPGLRATVLEGDAATDLLLQFHHACCDGLGALQVIEDVLVAYALAAGSTGRPGGLRPLDARLLRRRGSFGLTAWKLLRIAHQQAVGLLGARQFLMRRPLALTPHQCQPARAPLPEAYPSVCTRRFDRAELGALRAVARAAKTTVNDLLARDLFLALGDWKARHCPAGERDWLRISVPVSLRSPANRPLPAANVVSMVFLDRQPREFAHKDRLLEGIHRQMRLIKRYQLGLTFVLSARVFRAFPGGLSRMVKPDRCMATCVLTNLGKVLGQTRLPRREGRIVAGEAVLEGMDALAPLRPYTCAAFALAVYAGTLSVTLHFDPRPLTVDEAEDLLDTFARLMRDSIRSRR